MQVTRVPNLYELHLECVVAGAERNPVRMERLANKKQS